VTALGFGWAECRRLVSLPSMLQGGCFDCSAVAKQRALRATRHVAALEERSGAREIKKLLLGAIDPGELLALAHLAEDRQALFMSGDLRWMRIMQKRRFGKVRELIAGRILCLETVVAILVSRYGAAAVIGKLGDDPRYLTLKILLGQGKSTPEREFIEGVTSYRQNREREFGPDFFYSDQR
jgi:hypothetical protein